MTSQEIDQMIYNKAITAGFTPVSAKFVVAQSRLETRHYSSSVFNSNNNLFGMKFVGQALANRGTIAPVSERSYNCRVNNVCVDSDYYAAYSSLSDSASDAIDRLYNITRKGITPTQLKNSNTPEEYAHLLKIRDYYGGSESDYASTIRSILMRINVMDFYYENKKAINYTLIGGVIIGLTGYAYYLYRKGVFKKK